MRNKYLATCTHCGKIVEARTGSVIKILGVNKVFHDGCVSQSRLTKIGRM